MQAHSNADAYYVPPPSIWPLVGSVALLSLATGFVLLLNIAGMNAAREKVGDQHIGRERIAIHPELQHDVDAAIERVCSILNSRGSLQVSDLSKELNSSRKYIVPFLEFLDTKGITERRGNDRVPGRNFEKRN